MVSYSTQISISDNIRLDLFTPHMFRVRISYLHGDKFPGEYEIPFAIGKTDSWAPVPYTIRETDLHRVITTDALEIYCWKSFCKILVNDRSGNRLYPSTEPVYGLFQNHCAVFDSASVLTEPNENSRYCHWFYNHQTKRYDIFLKEDVLKDIFFIWTPDYPSAFRLFNTLVGAEPMPTRKSLGYYQTQHLGASGNQRMLMEAAKAFREKDIPCDTLILDFEWGDGVDAGKNIPWGTRLDWAEGYCSPLSPRDMLAQLADMHFQVMLIHHSIPGYPNQSDEGWIGKIYDYDHWWEAMDKHLADGVVGTWQDTRKNDISNGRIYADLQDHMGSGQRCAFLCNYDLYRNCNWTTDSLLIPTYQKIGGRRYPYQWTGDMIYDRWDELSFQVESIVNRHGSMKGITYLTNDCMRPGPQAISIRSAQFQCFNAITRCHNGKPWQNHSSLGDMAAKMAITSSENQDPEACKALPEQEFALIGLQNQDPVQEAIIRKFLKLRYRLLPYIYTFAHENYETGMPICRPMLLAFPNDPNCNQDQWPRQYMFGSELLAAPVCEDVQKMRVCLPAGCGWTDYWTGQHYEGGQIITVDVTDLSVMPLYLKDGAIIPMQEECSWIDHSDRLNTLYLDICPTADGSFTLYEDDGVSLAYQSGAFALTKIRCTAAEGSCLLTVGAAEGAYDAMPEKRAVTATVRLANGKTIAHSFCMNTAEGASVFIKL